MDHLSIELLTLIFIHLHREQKLRCMLVCRQWNHILNSGLDLETVTLSSSPSSKRFDVQYKLLIKRVLNEDSPGKKCKRLVLDHHSRVGFDKVTLARLFPNLKFLALLLMETKSSHTTPQFTKEQSKILEPWRNSLETLIERSYTKRLLDFLNTGVFTRLTTLVITPDTKVLYSHFSGLSHVLKNTPVLKNIHLHYHHIDLFDLQELHDNVPTLISLIMNTCRLTCSRGIPIHTQQPPTTTLLRTLKLSALSSTLNSTPGIVDFFVSAYTHLWSLSLVIGEYDCANYRDTDTHLESFFTDIVTKVGRHLTELELKIPIKTPQIYSFLEKRDTRLKRLDINALLDKRVLVNMVSLAAIHHLETLSLVQVPPLCFSIFKRLGGLKVLQLAFKRKMMHWFPIELVEMLLHLPETLEILELTYVSIDVAPTADSYRSNLKYLKLTYTEITETASRYLPIYFSKLDSLVLYYCRTNGNLDFSNHCFSFVHIVYYERHYCHLETDELDRSRRISTHLKLTTGDKSKHYMYRKPLYNGINPRFNAEYCDVHDHALRNLGTPAPYDESLKYLHFKCDSVQSFYYNGYLLL
ncbi:hypothetical protein K501DRAFT_268589 [Backusella circina FSU 941]|nr:hypothetical protein K501DRAFT_268589 [Backusella circina FSU 941]